MRTAGFFLIVAGASSYVLKAIGRQSLIMGTFGEYEKYAAPAVIVLGAILVVLSLRKKKDEKK
jgi:hypothetical protein